MKVAKKIFKHCKATSSGIARSEQIAGAYSRRQLCARCFCKMKAILKELDSESQQRIRAHILRRRFTSWRSYITQSKVKTVVRLLYKQSLSRKVLRGLQIMQRRNEIIGRLYAHHKKLNYFRLWKDRLQKKVRLRNFFAHLVLDPDEHIAYRFGNNENMLKRILAAWFGVVVDNEHTSSQRLNDEKARAYLNSKLLSKCFLQWKDSVRLS